MAQARQVLAAHDTLKVRELAMQLSTIPMTIAVMTLRMVTAVDERKAIMGVDVSAIEMSATAVLMEGVTKTEIAIAARQSCGGS